MGPNTPDPASMPEHRKDGRPTNPSEAARNAAMWCRAYADELEAGGWTEDAAYFRRQARLLDA